MSMTVQRNANSNLGLYEAFSFEARLRIQDISYFIEHPHYKKSEDDFMECQPKDYRKIEIEEVQQVVSKEETLDKKRELTALEHVHSQLNVMISCVNNLSFSLNAIKETNIEKKISKMEKSTRKAVQLYDQMNNLSKQREQSLRKLDKEKKDFESGENNKQVKSLINHVKRQVMQFCFLGAEELNRLPKHTKESIMKEIDEIVKIELTRETSQANYSSVLNDKGKQALETFNACKIHKAQNIMRKELEKGNTILDGLKMLIDTEENEIFVMQPEYSKFPLHTIPNFSLENCLNRKKKIAAKYKGLKLELVEKMLLEKASKNEEKITDVNKPEEKENIAPTQIPYTYDSHLSNFSDLIKAINLFDQLKRKKRTSINKISCRDIKKFKPQAQSLKKFRLYSSISKDILSLNFQKNKFRNHQPTPRVARWMSQKKVKEIYKHDPQYRNLGKSAFNQLAFRHQMAPVIPLMDIQDFMNRYGFSYTYNPQEKKEVEKVGFVAATHDKKGEPVKGYIFMAYDCKTKKVFHAFFQEHLKGISVIGETEKAFAELSDIPKEEEPWKVVGGKFVYDVLSNEKTIQIKFNEKSVSIVPIH